MLPVKGGVGIGRERPVMGAIISAFGRCSPIRATGHLDAYDANSMSEPKDAAEIRGDVFETLGDGRVREFNGDEGRSVLEFTCKPEMCHSGGVAQGGFVTGWVDAAMAHACIARYTTAFWIATLELKVSFFRPAGPGPVVAEGWIERAGKQTVFAEGRVLDIDGLVLAKASSTIRLVPNRV
jgi:acyl-CoA thioesterase